MKKIIVQNVSVTRPQGGTLGELLNRGVTKPVTKSVNIISGELKSSYIAQARYQNLFHFINCTTKCHLETSFSQTLSRFQSR